jgi:hypothetical protein
VFEKKAEWKRSLEARMKRTKVQHSFTLATSQVFRSAKNYNRKLGLAHAHFKRPEKTISCLPHAKFTVLEKS